MAKQRKQVKTEVAERPSITDLRTGVERKAPTKSPLGAEHLSALNTVIEECTQTAAMCDKCKEAGIDVEPEEKVNNEQLEMAKKLKAAFFPHST